MSDLRIDYDGEVFLVHCNFMMNDLLNDLPSKRWSKAKRAWRVGTAAASVAELERLSKLAGAEVTEAARVGFETVRTRVIQLKGDGRRFPSWYKFKREPRKHQWPALHKGYPLPGLALHMEMQTGKSKVVIDLITAYHMEGKIDAVVILTKRTLRRNWLERLEEDCPLPWHAILPDSGNRDRYERFLKEGFKFPWLIAGWESLSAGGLVAMIDKWFDHYGEKIAVIADESTYITNHKAIRTEHALRWGNLGAKRYTLAGAPALEGPMNLFSQFAFIDPNIVGIDDFLAFRNRYAVMGGYMRTDRSGQKVPTEVIGYQRQDELMRKIAPFTYQYLKTDGYDLPPKRHQSRTIELTKYQREVYNEIKREGTLTLTGSPAMVLENVLGVMLRLHQVAGGFGVSAREVRKIDKQGNPVVKNVYDPVRLIKPRDNPKMQEVVAALDPFRGKEQCLLWAVYMPEIEDLVELFEEQGWCVGQLHGKIPDKDRQPMINRFKDGNLDIIIGNAATGGMGYTMMNATVNAFYNNTHKAIDRVQAEDRNWGEGQKYSPIVLDFVAEKTIDVIIMEALKYKQDLSEFVRSRIREITRLLDGELK